MQTGKNISLVLGSGGARGLAHIGVLNPVPIAPTFNDDTDLTIAVNLGGPMLTEAEVKVQIPDIVKAESSFQKAITSFLSSAHTDSKSSTNTGMKNWGMHEIANKAFDAMQSTIGRQKIAAYPPEIEISIARNACATLEFERAREMIELGYRKTELSLMMFK